MGVQQWDFFVVFNSPVVAPSVEIGNHLNVDSLRSFWLSKIRHNKIQMNCDKNQILLATSFFFNVFWVYFLWFCLFSSFISFFFIPFFIHFFASHKKLTIRWGQWDEHLELVGGVWLGTSRWMRVNLRVPLRLFFWLEPHLNVNMN